MLIADTGTEASCFEDGLGKDNLRIFDAMSLQCGIKILDSQLLGARLHIIIYRRVLTGDICETLVEGLHLLIQRLDEWQWIYTCPAVVDRKPLKLQMEMWTGGTACRTYKSYDCSCLYHRSLLGIDLTKVTIEAAEIAMIDDDIVAVAGIAVVDGGHPAREHAIGKSVYTNGIYAVMEPAALGK